MDLTHYLNFIKTCQELQNIYSQSTDEIKAFISELLAPNIDARLFEIVSFAILKLHYQDQKIYWGYSLDTIKEEKLKLYKTGRTNANDGGIDYVMKPLGRFFQVTETLDFKKYFLDIDKIERYPITFVVKSSEDTKDLYNKIRENALKSYGIEQIVNEYMNCIEELINIPTLTKYLDKIEKNGELTGVLSEIINQSKVEFNYIEDETEE